MGMSRNTVPTSVAVGTTEPTSDRIPYENHAGGQVYVPAGSSITLLTWYGSDDGKTFYALYDGAANAVKSSGLAATYSCPIPDECFA